MLACESNYFIKLGADSLNSGAKYGKGKSDEAYAALASDSIIYCIPGLGTHHIRLL